MLSHGQKPESWRLEGPGRKRLRLLPQRWTEGLAGPGSCANNQCQNPRARHDAGGEGWTGQGAAPARGGGQGLAGKGRDSALQLPPTNRSAQHPATTEAFLPLSRESKHASQDDMQKHTEWATVWQELVYLFSVLVQAYVPCNISGTRSERHQTFSIQLQDSIFTKSFYT